jgi:D-amino-acid oxidase
MPLNAYHNRLLLGKNLSFDPTPLIAPSPSSPSILIIGGGVTGLITAWVLLDRGHHVTIASSAWATYTSAPRLTSQIAGALWEYPPAVCGSHTDTLSLRKSKHWCMVAYHIWAAIATDAQLREDAGVRMRSSAFFFPYALEHNPKQMAKLNEMRRCGVRGLRRDRGLIEGAGVAPGYGAVDAYELLVPTIDTDQCMWWLMGLVRGKGAAMLTEEVVGDLFLQEEALRRRWGADVIVNASGLASGELAGDRSCYPLRGALLRVHNDGKDFPKVEKALAIAADASKDSEIVFIVPRNNDILLLGGIAQKGERELDLKLDSPVIKRMRQRCEEFLPGLKNARLDEEYPLAQGVRPCRQRNVRVERELRVHRSEEWGRARPSRIVHNYGHGGAGWSLSFGCAEEVAGLVEDALRDLEAKPMGSEDFVVRSRL